MDKALDGFILEQILICKALLADIERRRPELSRPDYTPICPLWPETVMLLKKLLERQPRAPDQRLFVNRYGEPLSVSGVRFKLAAYVNAAAETMPSLQTKHVTPHSFRHATAVHLVSAGVDITVTRNWLGHVSLDTTNHYAKANHETKRKALEQVAVPVTTGHLSSWKHDTSLLAWLDTL
jgi:integrase